MSSVCPGELISSALVRVRFWIVLANVEHYTLPKCGLMILTEHGVIDKTYSSWITRVSTNDSRPTRP